MATKKAGKAASKRGPPKHRPASQQRARALCAPRCRKNEAIAQLTADHARVKKMFKQYERLAKATPATAKSNSWRTMICAELTAHATAEEEIFYPAARESIASRI